jgi:hypothetical protein
LINLREFALDPLMQLVEKFRQRAQREADELRAYARQRFSNFTEPE